MEVTVKGSTIKVELNGTRILDADLSKVTEFMDNKPHPGKDRTTGHFGFAGHNDPVAFRKVRIRGVLNAAGGGRRAAGNAGHSQITARRGGRELHVSRLLLRSRTASV